MYCDSTYFEPICLQLYNSWTSSSCFINWNYFCKEFCKKFWKLKNLILGTSDAWSMSRSSQQPCEPAYYIEDWRIFSHTSYGRWHMTVDFYWGYNGLQDARTMLHGAWRTALKPRPFNLVEYQRINFETPTISEAIHGGLYLNAGSLEPRGQGGTIQRRQLPP